ncbi:hypothetical protein RirG_062880 [Rhizophagus irregularis DAOM 197198w]|uniref:Uncharacterized protein n=1 Tax=Rhizophagus irregularis (strain DAOM 197198w) TaxID=1432141 RepID=A0A015L002_RHIIW|nr:hypothetical protein RirG_063020 [Rhizophagus irregularis DAOM 197198w]EXX73135.1 hypothetical protein RirG_062830 [Rhizophagus irregularis DAOM 197198w]EXX73140.1 hypothetical protein RirG_062880 [Rhizophagus irregularis DAOM 197198w]
MKKVASYTTSFIDITNCACKQKYKPLFSCIELELLNPNTVDKTVSSWSDTVEHYFLDRTNYKFDEFKKRCLNDPVIKKNLVRVYGKNGKETPGMLDCEVTKKLCLHAELNVLVKLMGQEGHWAKGIKLPFLDHIRSYTIFGNYQMPLKQEFIDYAMFELDNIIRLEIINHTNITAISDSDPDSGDSDTDQNFSTVGLNKLDYNYKHRNYRETKISYCALR